MEEWGTGNVSLLKEKSEKSEASMAKSSYLSLNLSEA